MKTKTFQSRFFSITLLVLAGLWIPWSALATWPDDPSVNVPISTAPGHQYSPTMVNDGSGGAIITWTDGRSGNQDIYVQHVDAFGTVLWMADGMPISTASNDQWESEIVSDGSGGAIITWWDNRSGNYDIYAQRVDAFGTVLWTADGVPISTASNDQKLPKIVGDGFGGAIITWMDHRSGNRDIYAQRVDASGTVLWTADGMPISTASNDQWLWTIVSDSSGGAIITWHDYRNGNWDIYAQRIDASGAVLWTTDGVPICTASDHQATPTIVADGSGGAIITWYDYRNGNSDIYAQHVDSSGNVLWT